MSFLKSLKLLNSSKTLYTEEENSTSLLNISDNLKVGLWMDFYEGLPKDYKASVQQTLAETSQQKISKLKTLFY